MVRVSLCRRAGILALAALSSVLPAAAQTPETATATLKVVTAEGLSKLTQEQVLALSGLQLGAQVGRKNLQDAADRLVSTGLFLNVRYEFHTHNDALSLAFHLQESPRLPIFFDNIPWFADSELNDAIRARLPFFDGTLPEAGAVVDTAADALKQLIASHKLDVTLEHQVFPNPIGDGRVQAFSISGASLNIAKVEFSDPAFAENPAVQQHVSELVGKPFSRVTIDVFLTEHVRPAYLKRGCLRVKLGPAQVRLTGNPNLPLPTQIPIYIPVDAGPLYRFAEAQWSGNNVLSTITLDAALGFKRGDLADGMALQVGWDRVSEEYGRRGYLEAQIESHDSYDDTAHTISFKVLINEGQQYRLGGFVLTGISPTGERKIYATFPVAAGEVFDKIKYEDYLLKLQNHSPEIFGELPIHYDTVGHWLRTDPSKGTVDVLLDFK